MANLNLVPAMCKVCLKKIRNFQYHLDCLTCDSKYHYQCLNLSREEYLTVCKKTFLCKLCISSELPFNHFDDDHDFYNAISELRFNTASIDFSQLNERCFIPFEVNDKYNNNIPLCDVDPDSNFYNDTYNTRNVVCDYHIEDSFMEYVDKHELKNLLSIYHFNARSFVPKKDQLMQYFDSLNCQFKVIGVSETWLNDDLISYANIDQYNCEHTIRPPGHIGGGVSIYVHDSIDFIKRSDLSVANHDIETCFIEIDKSVFSLPKNILIG